MSHNRKQRPALQAVWNQFDSSDSEEKDEPTHNSKISRQPVSGTDKQQDYLKMPPAVNPHLRVHPNQKPAAVNPHLRVHHNQKPAAVNPHLRVHHNQKPAAVNPHLRVHHNQKPAAVNSHLTVHHNQKPAAVNPHSTVHHNQKPPGVNTRTIVHHNQKHVSTNKKSLSSRISQCNVKQQVSAETVLKSQDTVESMEMSTLEQPRRAPHQRVYPMSFLKLKELVDKDPNELLLSLSLKSLGFHLNLEKNQIRRDEMAYILIALGKACTSNARSIVCTFISEVTTKQKFIIIQVQIFLAESARSKNEGIHLSAVSYFVDFLKMFQQIQPSSAAGILPLLLPHLSITANKVFAAGTIQTSRVLAKIQEIEEQNDFFMKKYTPEEIKKISKAEKLQLEQPPENFRTIEILPSQLDIQQPFTFLRPNLVEGKYLDVEHYLDVQFRLLREDYVRPLREGISEYLRVKKSNGNLKRNKDIKIYDNVHIMKEEFLNGTLLHIAHFEGKEFQRVNWEFSKRFLTGSLLCLTRDDFETMLFASVAMRDPKNLQKGLLTLRFEEETDAVLNLNSSMSFTAVETDAYFEAYRYNLAALHDLSEENLPMKQYIVDVKKTVEKPEYLSASVTYDLRPLFLPLRSQSTTDEDDLLIQFPSNIERMKHVPVLNEDKWPATDEIDLDDSQYLALKSAITQEFSVIQGPPGTGKTHVGLRIAQLLLHNFEKWQPENDHSPILVVCYTNHALDQFLEGVLQFTKKIVRIGGRGQNELLSGYQLNNIKKEIKLKREVPHFIFGCMKQKHWDLRVLKRTIDEEKKIIEKCFKTVLDENDLQDNMLVGDNDHHASLKKIVYMYPEIADDNRLLHDWLNVRVTDLRQRIDFWNRDSEAIDENKKSENVEENTPENNDNVDQVESDGEGDVEYIEAQRNIDAGEYVDVSYVLKDEDDEVYDVQVANQEGWQVQGNRRAIKKYIKKNLLSKDMMEESEAARVHDVWMLSMPDRWRLYRFWLHSYIEEKTKGTYEMQKLLRSQYSELLELRTEEDLYVLKKSQVIGMTTTGASKYRTLVQRLNPRIVIVEEAAEILESHIVTSLAPGTQHVILIGDHQQLRPNPTVHFLAVNFGLNISLFERMVKNGIQCHRLSVQHRMRPEIAALLVPHIYKDLKNHESVMNFESMKGIKQNVFFLSHSFTEVQEKDSKSKVNIHEANFLIRLCKHIILQGYEPSQITVLTTYSGQMFALKKLATGVVKNVRITVVDNFQGEENDIILLSFVRSNEEGAIGFLKVANRVCVALSRAKKFLYCIGNFALLSEKSDLWKNITETLNQQKSIGTSLELVCQNHPEVSTLVTEGTDFDTAPEGGCKLQCEYRLECGHTCSLVCHSYDQLHETVRCQKPCAKPICKFNHLCTKKCYQKCGDCKALMPKTLPDCFHTIQVKCWLLDFETKCTEECEKMLLCGHQCSNKCSESCTVSCKQLVLVKSPICGHEVFVECCDTENLELYFSKCKVPCKEELQCGHLCTGTCSRCCQGRVHVLCNQKCTRILVCGHACTSSCSRSCPPCRKQCENQCKHNKCPKKCGEPCVKCVEPCEWSCEHGKCLKPCGEQCSRKPCDEPCEKMLKCGHPCIGLCGEPCPLLCRICDEESVTELFFGSEDEQGARFVLLEDCNHIFEVDKLAHWMNMESEKVGEIQMKACPRCKTVIRKNQRFGNIVKSCLGNIEQVKIKTFGDKSVNDQLKETLLKRLTSSGNHRLAKLCDPIIKRLLNGRGLSIQQLTTLENISTLASKFLKSSNELAMRVREDCDERVKCSIEKVSTFLTATINMIEFFIQDDYLTASEQQLYEILQEIRRVELGSCFFKLTKDRAIHCSNANVISVANALTRCSTFKESDASNLNTLLEQLAQSFGTAVINVSVSEKESILKAMALTRGHWYQCPNGHVYCITECGGAMQEGNCNECGARIGGGSHALRSDNRVATDMDGSRHSAWPGTHNMGDYDLVL